MDIYWSDYKNVQKKYFFCVVVHYLQEHTNRLFTQPQFLFSAFFLLLCKFDNGCVYVWLCILYALCYVCIFINVFVCVFLLPSLQTVLFWRCDTVLTIDKNRSIHTLRHIPVFNTKSKYTLHCMFYYYSWCLHTPTTTAQK